MSLAWVSDSYPLALCASHSFLDLKRRGSVFFMSDTPVFRKLLFLLGARDFDELTPWLFLSFIVVFTLLLFLHVQSDFLLFPPKRILAHSSHIEIQLADIQKPIPGVAAPWKMPELVTGGRVLASVKENKSAVPAVVRQKELAAYLVQWQNAIIKVAQAHLKKGEIPSGRIVVDIILNPRGEILRIHCASTNYNAMLVQAVQSIIVAAAPFPPLPSAWQKPPQNLRIARTWNFS